jgi:hypothetical protein
MSPVLPLAVDPEAILHHEDLPSRLTYFAFPHQPGELEIARTQDASLYYKQSLPVSHGFIISTKSDHKSHIRGSKDANTI